MQKSNVNVQRLTWYMICTGMALSVPSSLSCMDLLLLRMHFDYALFGVIKSSMFFLPPIVYFFAADLIRRSGHNELVCRWSYLIRILLPFLLPVTALLTENPVIRMTSWIFVLSFSYTAAMIANNTLLGLYRETIVRDKFNRYSLFFSAVLSVPGSFLNIPELFYLGGSSWTDRQFLWQFLLVETLSALCYVPAFLVLRNLAKLHRTVSCRTLSLKERFQPFTDREYQPVLWLTLIRSVWSGVIAGYWIVCLITIRHWNIGWITAAETLFCVLMLLAAKPLGKIADLRGYRFCFTLLLLISIGASCVQLCFWESFAAALLFLVVIHNGFTGLVSNGTTMLISSASAALAKPECTENYIAVFTLCGSIGSFTGSCTGGVLLKLICGKAVPSSREYFIYFLLASLLLIPQLFFAFRLKKDQE